MRANIFSWKLSEEEIKSQVNDYNSFKITSYRSVSVFFILFSLALTFILGIFNFGGVTIADALWSSIAGPTPGGMFFWWLAIMCLLFKTFQVETARRKAGIKNEFGTKDKYLLISLYVLGTITLALAVSGVSDGLYLDTVVYLFLAILLTIFKAKKTSAILAIVVSGLYIVLVLISIGLENSGPLELLISVSVLTATILHYKNLKTTNANHIHQSREVQNA